MSLRIRLLRWHVWMRSAPMFHMSKSLLDDTNCKRAFLRSLLASPKNENMLPVVVPFFWAIPVCQFRPRPSPENHNNVTFCRALLLCPNRSSPKHHISFEIPYKARRRATRLGCREVSTMAVPYCRAVFGRHVQSQNVENSSAFRFLKQSCAVLLFAVSLYHRRNSLQQPLCL